MNVNEQTGSAYLHIPIEFRPDLTLESHFIDSEDEGFSINTLFWCDNDSGENMNEVEFETILFGSFSYKISLPPDVGTLFAHKVWSGSKLLARYLLDHASLVSNKRTIELGAGTALPSLVALSLGSALSILTDYPNDRVLQSLRHTVGYNWDTCSGSSSRVAVLGHEWGSDVSNILQQVKTMTESNQYTHFHVILLSECLWNHSCHDKLAKSINSLLHPTEGVAIVTYAHHVPGKERDDDAFFPLCHEKYNLVTEHVLTQNMPYMWDQKKTIDIYLKLLKRGLS